MHVRGGGQRVPSTLVSFTRVSWFSALCYTFEMHSMVYQLISQTNGEKGKDQLLIVESFAAPFSFVKE